MQIHKEAFEQIISKLDKNQTNKYSYFHPKSAMVPSREEVISIVDGFLSLMFEEYFSYEDKSDKLEILDSVFTKLKRQITASYSFCSTCDNSVVDTEEMALNIMSLLPSIKDSLLKDVQAIYEGDPASTSPEEVLLSYPGFFAIAIYRIAHEFYIRKIPYISRIMTEYAHGKTGIDIHAGASIGGYFFIDHGTGIVIGETTTIGDHVKIYQGVTLGAKSFELDSNGNPVKAIKRHPDIGNNCTIYANATILGGNTKIGDGATIGANVWLTRSVEPGTVVYYTPNSK